MNTLIHNFDPNPPTPSPAWEFDPATELRTIPGGWEMGDVLKPPALTSTGIAAAAAGAMAEPDVDMENFLEPRTIPTGWDLSDTLGEIIPKANESTEIDLNKHKAA